MTDAAQDLTSVVVVEDHPLFREALVEALRRRPGIELVGEAADGEEALERIRELRPDVALVDLRMPKVSGMDVLRQVVAEGIGTRIVILSAEVDDAVRGAVERAGAAGCLPKSADAADIAAAVIAARTGGPLPTAPPEPPLFLPHEGLLALGLDQPLSARELEVLRMVAEGDSAPGIAARLHLSPATVSTHLKHIYQKLGVPDRAAAVARAMRSGLLR
jgi:two-component system, NarL family, nitrate/nitrite response regulator NarL